MARARGRKVGHRGPRVFISSTYLDNADRRRLVEDAVLQAGMLPVGMERFTASEHPAVDECQRLAAECDIYVLIIAHRYGWVPPEQTVSITELEYDAAKNAQRPRYVFMLSDTVPIDRKQDYDAGPDGCTEQQKLDTFKARCCSDQMAGVFTDHTLQAKVLEALYKWRDDQAPRLEVESPEEPTPSALAAEPQELARYKRAAESIHDRLLPAGFATGLRVPLDLEGLYVPLYATVDLRGSGQAAFADAREAAEHLVGRSSDIALVHAFREAQRLQRRALVILGDPGSGKTTHLERLMLYCLRNGARVLGLAEELVPVFLPLRELRDRTQGLSSFIENQLDAAHSALPSGFGQRLLERGRLLLLFDGLDEVVDAEERKAVAHWIEQAVSHRADCTVVVTCRFAGYGEDVRFSADFLELHLRPLTPEQSETFIRHWYRIVETCLDTGEDPALAQTHAKERAEDLLARLREPGFRTARLATMTRNPLLLANLCLVHRDRGNLPTGRARLYAECVDVLLEHWRRAKGLAVEITAEAGRRALQPAALWLHKEEGRVRAGAAELAPVLEPGLAAVQYKGGNVHSFLRTVRDASGLLTGWGPAQYGFMHLGFQEYLAACEIRRRHCEGDATVLAELAAQYGQSWWQEVILILVALGNPSLFVPFMREVVKHEGFASTPALLSLLLAESAEVSTAPFMELLAEPQGSDAGLWARQVLALRAVEGAGTKEERAALRAKFAGRPELRGAWVWPASGRLMSEETGAGPEPATVVTENGGVELILIPGSTFMMGSPKSEEGRFDFEGPQHQVTVSSFYLARCPVTNEEYGRFLQAHPDAAEPQFWGDRRFNQARQPVVGVSWDDAQRFAVWAGGRLPTEAEWEYACRAGTVGSRYEELSVSAWYWENSQRQLRLVGEKRPNGFGLCDMLGNVWEWCSDWSGPYPLGPHTDPFGPPEGLERVLRGGSWRDDAAQARSARRFEFEPGYRDDFIGFRLARRRNSR